MSQQTGYDSTVPYFCLGCDGQPRKNVHIVLQGVNKSCAQILNSLWVVRGIIPSSGFVCHKCLQILHGLEEAKLKFITKRREFESRLKASSTLGQMMNLSQMMHLKDTTSSPTQGQMLLRKVDREIDLLENLEEHQRGQAVQRINSQTQCPKEQERKEIQIQVIIHLKNGEPELALQALIRLPEASQEMRKLVQSLTRSEIMKLDQVKRGQTMYQKIAELQNFSLQQQAADLQYICPTLYYALEGALSSLENKRYLMGSIMYQMLYAHKPNQIWTMQGINTIMMWLLGCRNEIFDKLHLAGWCMGYQASSQFIDNLVAKQQHNDLVRMKKEVEAHAKLPKSQDLDIKAMETRVIQFLGQKIMGKRVSSATSSNQTSQALAKEKSSKPSPAEENMPRKAATPRAATSSNQTSQTGAKKRKSKSSPAEENMPGKATLSNQTPQVLAEERKPKTYPADTNMHGQATSYNQTLQALVEEKKPKSSPVEENMTLKDENVVIELKQVKCDMMKKPFFCKYCRRYFDHIQNFKKHTRRHEYRYWPLWKKRCKQKHIHATEQFLQKEAQIRHNMTNATKQLEQNKNLTHGNQCQYCCRNFTEKQALVKHITNHIMNHAKEQSFQCPHCKKIFAEEGAYEHMRTHAIESCQKTHIIESFQCQYCCQTFPTQEILLRHVKTHMYQNYQSNNPSGPTKCSVPNEMILMKPYAVIYTGDKPYGCQLCTETFAQKQMLIEHMQTHTDRIRYRCHLCFESFADRKQWTAHVRTHTENNK